jgi:hypothetical protein
MAEARTGWDVEPRMLEKGSPSQPFIIIVDRHAFSWHTANCGGPAAQAVRPDRRLPRNKLSAPGWPQIICGICETIPRIGS